MQASIFPKKSVGALPTFIVHLEETRDLRKLISLRGPLDILTNWAFDHQSIGIEPYFAFITFLHKANFSWANRHDHLARKTLFL